MPNKKNKELSRAENTNCEIEKQQWISNSNLKAKKCMQNAASNMIIKYEQYSVSPWFAFADAE